MNERIKKLAKNDLVRSEYTESGWQECYRYEFEPAELQQFVQLIVRECVGIIAKRKDQAIDDGWNVDEAMSMAEMDLLEHFGVEE